MITPKVDKLRNFMTVRHQGMNTLYRMHMDDKDKLGTPEKVCVYEVKDSAYFAPNKDNPHGQYKAKTRLFVASFLSPV